LGWGKDPDSLSELGGGEKIRLIADRGLASRLYGFYYSSMSIYRTRLSAVLLGDPVVSVLEEGGGGPDGFQLGNYPNPFNSETIIRWQIVLTSFVDLRVYDVLGREVAMLVNETRPAGRYEVTFDASRLATGIYLCRLSAGDYVQVRKMILLR
jgi:hypothetical protein